jgi:ADP-heptose:LPS heptosyltransferase
VSAPRHRRHGEGGAEGGILAIRLRTLGDVVLVTPALRALRRGHPGRPLEVVTEARYATLLEGLPEVARVWSARRSTAATVELAWRLRGRRLAWAVDFFGNPRSAFLARASGARRRAGYDLRGRAGAYHVRVPRTLAPAPGHREPAAATHLRLAVAAGGVPDGDGPRVSVAAGARAAAIPLLEAAGLGEPGRAIGLVAAGTWATKTWPVGHAALLARELIAAGRPVLLIGGPGEEATAAAMRRLAPGIRLLAPCDVGRLAAVIERLGAVVGTDSGPRHLAAALGLPTFGWFGPTHPETWNPAGPRHGFWWTELPCRGCDRTQCPHWNCLPALEPATAARLVLGHLERHGR